MKLLKVKNTVLYMNTVKEIYSNSWPLRYTWFLGRWKDEKKTYYVFILNVIF